MIELRSYRRVFELERRIYRIDRLRLNPGGVPVRGVVYFLALVVLSVLAGAMPLIGVLARALPWYVRALLLPGLGAALLALIRVEGRPFHLAARALLGYGVAPRHTAGLEQRTGIGGCWRPDEVLLLPDGSDAHIRRLRYVGPGSALVTVAHERALGGAFCRAGGLGCAQRHGVLRIRELTRQRPLVQGQVLVLARGVPLLTLGSARAKPRTRTPSSVLEADPASSAGAPHR
jgi:hypothetical protein